jgi:two-component system chemotaxis sensor kinase CheA
LDDFDKEIKVGFLDEAEQALVDAEKNFLELESNSTDLEPVDRIFRLAHNLKGGSRAVGFDQMGLFTHEFESLLLKIKKKELAVTSAAVSLLLRCTDHLRAWISELRKDLGAQFDSQELLAQIQRAKNLQAEVIQQEIRSENKKSETENSVGIIAEAVEAIPVQKTKKSQTVQSSADESIRVPISKLEKLINFVGEMVIIQSVLREQSNHQMDLGIKNSVRQMNKVSKEIQDLSMGLRMLPIKPTFQKMQRIVRDTAQALGKNIELILVGEETELDKTILEKIGDPLVHLIRNSVDHGVELPEKRIAAGKKPQGRVTLSAQQESGRLHIKVEDDGGGIHPDKIRAKAIEKGLIKESTILSDEEVIQLIFAPGFSTKELVTDVSGRGVGMDVVKTNIQELSGDISIENKVHQGTCFNIYLPLTLAIIEGMVVEASKQRFVIPLEVVAETIKLTPDKLLTTSAGGDFFLLRNEQMPIFRLNALLGSREASLHPNSIVLVVRDLNQTFAILVDDILGQFQIVTKPLSQDLEHIPGVNGTTILGDGKPALILDPIEMVKRDLKNISRFSSMERSA